MDERKKENIEYSSLCSHYDGCISMRIIYIITCMIMQLSSQLFSNPFSSSPSYCNFFKDILMLGRARWSPRTPYSLSMVTILSYPKRNLQFSLLLPFPELKNFEFIPVSLYAKFKMKSRNLAFSNIFRHYWYFLALLDVHWYYVAFFGISWWSFIFLSILWHSIVFLGVLFLEESLEFLDNFILVMFCLA